MNALERLRAVLCAPDGEVVIDGDDADRSIVAEALKELDAALSQPAGVAEPNGKLVGWWNGIKPDVTERSPYGPSVRWGADAEDRAHDIPLYDGYNPVHFTKPTLPSVEAFASAIWRDWMTNEQADKLGAELHAWLRAHIAAAPAASGREDMPFATTQMVVRALTHLGHSTPQSQEEQYARSNELVLTLCREVMATKAAPNPPAGASVSERARNILADAWVSDTRDAKTAANIRTGPLTHTERIAVAAIEHALSSPRQEGDDNG